MRYLYIVFFFFIFIISCKTVAESPVSSFTTADQKATPQTKALFSNLDRFRQEHVLFGHQDDLAYGYNWINEPGRSDVFETAGSYPAVYGWELGDLELGN